MSRRIPAARLGAIIGIAAAALPGAAFADSPSGHYHPNDIAAASTVFASAADTVGPRYEAAAGTLKSVGSGLELLELGALAMGTDAPDGLLEWMEQSRRQATGEHMRLQRHVDLMGEDYSTEFGAALDRVLQSHGEGLVECGASGIAAMVGGKNCPGADANGRLAAAIDADSALQAAIASIGRVEWPAVTKPSQTWTVTPLTGTESWVQAGALVRALLPARIETHQDNLDRALSAILEDDSLSKEAQIAAARDERSKYAQALAADGAVLFPAVASALERGAKKGGPSNVGLCANAPALGGCTGTDATRAVVNMLREDKKFQKAIASLQ